MKAMLCRALDGPDALTLEDLPDAVAGTDEVVVGVEAAAINFFDTLITRGRYQTKPDLPFSPAGEIAGRVLRVGERVEGWRRGDRVLAYLGYGGAREQVVVPAERLVAIPDGVSAAIACTLPITYGTAVHGLVARAQVQRGETVVVLGAAGGAGLAAVEVAKTLGARVVAVASSADKLALCRDHGADVGLMYGGNVGALAAPADLKTLIRDATGGAGCDVIYDCVGGSHSEPAVRALRWGGRFLVVGFASGDIPKLPLNLLLLKGSAALGVYWGEAVKRDPAGHRRDMAYLLEQVVAGHLRPHIGETLPLAATADAIRRLDARTATGKIVLRVGA